MNIREHWVAVRWLLLAVIVVIVPSRSTAAEWPWVLDRPGGKVVVYQPEPESFSGDTLRARSAVAVTMKGQTDPAFGVIWFKAKVETDKDARMVSLVSLVVTAAKFPSISADTANRVAAFVEGEAPKANFEFALDELLASLAATGQNAKRIENLNNTPPKILVLDYPALLVLVDGEPILVSLQGTALKRLVNTPYFVVQDPGMGKFYLRAGAVWYSASDVKGKWNVEPSPPEAVTGLASMMADEVPDSSAPAGKTPAIVVSTEPCELLATDGPPKFSPIEGTQLLYVTNTQNDLFMDVNMQQYYVLFSGRWFTARATAGPWSYVEADKLPADFAKIPSVSPKADVRASVAGTTEAQEAVLDAQIPQTAKVDRNMAAVNIEYDGQPKFETIEGTSLAYAVNSSTTVIRSGNSYLVCDNGVWFASSSPMGPWSVATTVPDEVYGIPPTSPVYNTTYVHVYEATPEYVYVGYYPGYMGCYVYGPTVVYGTGWYYPPWYGAYYYPRPVTYGFGFHYNPWMGWGMGVTVGGPHYRVSFGWGGGYHGWWGPPMYRPPYYHPGYRPAYARPTPYARNTNINSNVNIYNGRQGAVTRPGTNRPTASQLPANRPPGGQSLQQPGRPAASAMPNNVYSDKNGNVYKKSGNGWQKNDKSGWQNMDRPQSRELSSSHAANRSSLDRQAQTRQRGAERSQSYRNSGMQNSQSMQRPQQRQSGGGRRR